MTLTHFYQYSYRISSAIIGASLVTLGLLMFMHQLIKMDTPPTIVDTTKIDTTFMEPPEDIETIIENKPVQPIEPVVEPTTDFDPIDFPNPIDGIAIAPPEFNNNNKINLQGSANGNAISMLQVAPNYPERARRRGIEGHVDLMFDLTATGQTYNIRILNAEPTGYFENASIRALKKWKYKPAMEDGQAIAMHNMTTRIHYSLDN